MSSTMGRRLIKLRMPRMFAVSFLSCRLHSDADVISDQQRQLGSRDIPSSGEIPATFRQIKSGRRRVDEEAQTLKPPTTSSDQMITKKNPTPTTSTSTKTKIKMKIGTESSNTTLPTSSTDSPFFFSTDEEEVTTTKMSLKHPSFSDSESEISPEYSLPRRTYKRRSNPTRRRKPRCINQTSASNKLPAILPTKGKVEESVAVTKRSTDPYTDFRSSMAEMIVEKELVKVEELFQLLDCFLSLNSPRYHRIIIDAFEEICEALFRNWC